MTSDGNNFNYFPENQLTELVQFKSKSNNLVNVCVSGFVSGASACGAHGLSLYAVVRYCGQLVIYCRLCAEERPNFMHIVVILVICNF